MQEKLITLLPEISLIKQEQLRQSVMLTFIEALETGGWQPEDMDTIPFTLLIPNCSISFLTHTRAVTRMCISTLHEFNDAYQAESRFNLDHDTLIAGALLHDVGKLVEYEKSPAGKHVKSAYGKNLRHPFSGTALAVNNGVPYEIAHIIANHAKEGDGTLRSPEAVVVHKIDMLNFEGLKSFLGMI